MKYSVDIEKKEIAVLPKMPRGHVEALEAIFKPKGYKFIVVNEIISIHIDPIMGTQEKDAVNFDVDYWMKMMKKTGMHFKDSSRSGVIGSGNISVARQGYIAETRVGDIQRKVELEKLKSDFHTEIRKQKIELFEKLNNSKLKMDSGEKIDNDINRT